MELKEILDKNIIRIGLDAADKDDALRKLAQLLHQHQYVSDVEDFVTDIYYRESQGVTGIGQGVAIPHGKSKSASKLGIAIATLKKPIQWETLDDKDVCTIFLFCVSSDSNFERNHMVLLSKVAARLADDELISKVNHAKSADELIAYLGGEA